MATRKLLDYIIKEKVTQEEFEIYQVVENTYTKFEKLLIAVGLKTGEKITHVPLRENGIFTEYMHYCPKKFKTYEDAKNMLDRLNKLGEVVTYSYNDIMEKEDK